MPIENVEKRLREHGFRESKDGDIWYRDKGDTREYIDLRGGKPTAYAYNSGNVTEVTKELDKIRRSVKTLQDEAQTTLI